MNTLDFLKELLLQEKRKAKCDCTASQRHVKLLTFGEGTCKVVITGYEDEDFLLMMAMIEIDSELQFPDCVGGVEKYRNSSLVDLLSSTSDFSRFGSVELSFSVAD
ncbi:hypothetical protein TNCV_1031001 [Trichonephila clavipes]|nr:hypothetical protein TNCV_1031001 [Trichonephila clavipes]